MPALEKPKSPDFFNFDDAALQAISAAWSLPDCHELFPIALEHETCTLLQVRSSTSRKAILPQGQSRYFLKEVPWYARSDEQLATSYTLQVALARAADLTLPPLLTGSGLPYLDFRGTRFTLTPFRESARFVGSPAQIESAGIALGRMQRCQVALPRALREDYFSLVGAFVQLAQRQVDGAVETHALLALLSETLERERARAAEQGWSELPDTAVHGDFNPWNLLFRADATVLAIVDFDNCDLGPTLRDLAEALLMFCGVEYARDTTGFARPFHIDLQLAAASRLLAGYEYARGAPLDSRERACLQPVVRAVIIEIAALGMLRGEIDSARDRATLERWLCAEPGFTAVLGERP